MSPDVLSTPILTTSAAQVASDDAMSAMPAMAPMRSIRPVMRPSPCRAPVNGSPSFAPTIQQDLADVVPSFHARMRDPRVLQRHDRVDTRTDFRAEQRPDARAQDGRNLGLALERERSQ